MSICNETYSKNCHNSTHTYTYIHIYIYIYIYIYIVDELFIKKNVTITMDRETYECIDILL